MSLHKVRTFDAGLALVKRVYPSAEIGLGLKDAGYLQYRTASRGVVATAQQVFGKAGYIEIEILN